MVKVFYGNLGVARVLLCKVVERAMAVWRAFMDPFKSDVFSHDGSEGHRGKLVTYRRDGRLPTLVERTDGIPSARTLTKGAVVGTQRPLSRLNELQERDR